MAARWLEIDSPTAISSWACHPAYLSAARVEPKHESRWRPPPEVHDQVHSSACETNDHSPLLLLRCAPPCQPMTGKMLPRSEHESRWRPPPEVHDQVHSSACETNDHSPLLLLRCAPPCQPMTGKMLPLRHD